MKRLFTTAAIAVLGLCTSVSNVNADEFHADVLHSGVVAEFTTTQGTQITTFDLDLVTTGIMSHVEFNYYCNVLGINNSADNYISFKDDNDNEILNVTGCAIAGVDNYESVLDRGDRIIPIPVGTQSIELYANQGGQLASYSGNRSKADATILGELYDGIDMSLMSFSSFEDQNVDNDYTIGDNGYSINLLQNTWVYMPYQYTVTADTVLEFDFKSEVIGEAFSIGFIAGGYADGWTESLIGLVHNQDSETLGTIDYKYNPSNDGWTHYRIPIGRLYTGSFPYLLFIHDDDRAINNGDSAYRNIKVYEDN